jgi:hypothetical protein
MVEGSDMTDSSLILVPASAGAPRQFYPAINADKTENRSDSIIPLPFLGQSNNIYL